MFRWMSRLRRRAGPEIGRGMSGAVTSSAASLPRRMVFPIAYTLHAFAGPCRIATADRAIHSLALDQSIWDGVVAAIDATCDVLT